MPQADFEAAYDAVSAKMALEGVHGAAVTPFLLGELARQTRGRSLRGNVALLLNNARTAAQIARSLLDSGAAT